MKFSIRSRIKSFRYAFEGIITMLKEEHNSRIHLVAAIFAVVAGFLLDISLKEWALIVIVSGFVFLAELVNSAIELMADKIDPRTDPEIKKIKDYAAAGVLIAALVSMIVGGLVFIPALIEKLVLTE